jgi:hypothetical protein
VAFRRGGVTDASPLGAASPLGTPSADGARNVIALARHALADRACRLIAYRRKRFRQRLQGSAETAAARADIAHARQAGARSATAGPDARGRRDSGAGNGRPHGGCGPGTAYGRVGRERVAGISTGTADPGRPGIIRVTRLSDLPERSLESKVVAHCLDAAVGDLVLLLASHLRPGAVAGVAVEDEDGGRSRSRRCRAARWRACRPRSPGIPGLRSRRRNRAAVAVARRSVIPAAMSRMPCRPTVSRNQAKAPPWPG